MSNVETRVEEAIKNNVVTVFSKSYCPFCDDVKKLFKQMKIDFFVIELDLEKKGKEMQKYLKTKTGQNTVPNIFFNEKHIGGGDEIRFAKRKGQLKTMLKEAGAM